MERYAHYVIKSFKHDGHLHRVWLDNWKVPESLLYPEHTKESMTVLINCRTRIREANGEEWVSKIPGVSFFIPKQWYNIVALVEEEGIRYYCNMASPPYDSGGVITYIDYDLDVIVSPDRKVQLVDQEEYAKHKRQYRYSETVEAKVRGGLEQLLLRIEQKSPPFQDDLVLHYFRTWSSAQP